MRLQQRDKPTRQHRGQLCHTQRRAIHFPCAAGQPR